MVVRNLLFLILPLFFLSDQARAASDYCRAVLGTQEQFVDSLPPRLKELFRNERSRRHLLVNHEAYKSLYSQLDEALKSGGGPVQWEGPGGLDAVMVVSLDPAKKRLSLKIASLGIFDGEELVEIGKGHEYFGFTLSVTHWLASQVTRHQIRSAEIFAENLINRRLVQTLLRLGFKMDRPGCGSMLLVSAFTGSMGAAYSAIFFDPDWTISDVSPGLTISGVVGAATALACWRSNGIYRDYRLEIKIPGR